MPIRFLTVSAALCLIAAPTLAEIPASPAGDWQGTMTADRGPIRSAVHIIQASDGALAGDIDLPDNGIWNAPLDQVVLRDGTLSFAYRGGTRRFEGRWDETAKGWAGQFHTPGGATALILRPGLLGLPVIAGLDGRWDAELNQGQAQLVLRVATDAHGTHALLDLPHALETDLPVNPLTAKDGTIAFAVPGTGIQFEGALTPDGKALKGRFGAPGSDVALNFVRNDKGGPARPQTPVPPFPYAIKTVFLDNPKAADVRLGCTLTVPQGPGPHPVAILLSGTGQQDRDETLVAHRPFLVLADHLARHGVAALRCDDRGAGSSTGEFHAATLEDFAGDVVAAIDVLKARSDIDAKKIGLMGHSEGGIVASMVAADRKDMAFMVQIAGPGMPVFDLLLAQGEAAGRAQGLPEAAISQQSMARRAVYEAVRSAKTPDAARAAVETLLTGWGLPADMARTEAAMATRPDILRILRVDPAVSLAKISAPVLAVVGSKDTQVPPAQNLPALRKALSGNGDATVTELSNLNHMLQTARTGAAVEYYGIEETINPAALKVFTDWLGKRGFGRP